MTKTEFTTDTMEVLQFVKKYIPLLASEKMNAIGLKRDGELVAGILYERWTPHSVWVHLASVPGKRWANRDFLYYCFAYPFLQVGVTKLLGFVESSNMEARKLDEHLGFVQEAVLTNCTMDGGDAIIYSMTKEQCRFLTLGVKPC